MERKSKGSGVKNKCKGRSPTGQPTQATFGHKLSPFRHFVSGKNCIKKEILDKYNS